MKIKLQKNKSKPMAFRSFTYRAIDKIFRAEGLALTSTVYLEWVALRENFYKSFVALGTTTLTFSVIYLLLVLFMPEGVRMPLVSLAVSFAMLAGVAVSIWHIVSSAQCIFFKHSHLKKSR
jgi:uncharacterized membrane protein (DUF485 family)